MRYINKETGDIISFDTYLELSLEARFKYVEIKEKPTVKKTHKVIETKSDSLSTGDGIALGILAVISLF